MGPGLDGVLQQVCARAFDQVHERQLVRDGDVHRAEDLRHAHRRNGTCVDAAVVGHDQAADAAHETDAADHAGARHARLAVRVFDQEVREVVQLEEGQAGIEQPLDTLARSQLASLRERLAPLLGECLGPRFAASEPLDQLEHLPLVGEETVGGRVHLGLERGHGEISSSERGTSIGSSSSSCA